MSEAGAQERIERAAIRWGGVVYDVPRPGRHHDVFRVMKERGVKLGPGRAEERSAQGFVTSAGRFVERYEGKRIARAAGQLLDRASPSPQLFSEDVW